jgi:hypothetical protein
MLGALKERVPRDIHPEGGPSIHPHEQTAPNAKARDHLEPTGAQSGQHGRNTLDEESGGAQAQRLHDAGVTADDYRTRRESLGKYSHREILRGPAMGKP